MPENLRIAFRKQRRLVLIFLLTIFLPALTLGVFGVRAIRNERFRLARQEENEARRAARFVKGHFESKLGAIDRALGETAREPSVISRDLAAVRELAANRFAADPLVAHVVLLYRNEEPLFPLLAGPPLTRSTDAAKAGNASLASGIRGAQTLEFVEERFRAAAARFRELSGLTSDRHLRAELLTGQARCLQKAGEFDAAARVYAQVVEDYADCATSSGLPLGIQSRLQIVECRKRSGDQPGATEQALGLFRELLEKPSPLSKDQFKTYVSLARETIDTLLEGNGGISLTEGFKDEYSKLKKREESRQADWQAMEMFEEAAGPELKKLLAQPEGSRPSPYRFARNVGGKDMLLLAAWVPGRTGETDAGVLGVQLDNDHLAGTVLAEALRSVDLAGGAELVLADLTGRPFSPKTSTPAAPPLATEYFEDNFPPWKIELFQAPAREPGILDLRRNFYFWTILTLIVVLAFGAFLIARTIGHEMEILKIKSDFVSSVSHEFKTPLTSIKALMERLIDGKVREAGKMDQYYAIIAQDTDKLTRLVNNLLDFSKIEEGKKEYVFADTDIVRIVDGTGRALQKEQDAAGPDIRLEVQGEIPTLRADADALSRALANLLSNAVKFTPPGKAIRVGLEG